MSGVDLSKGIDGIAVLEMPMPPNDAEAPTVGAFLIALLEKLWDEGEAFSGKRPFGNSGWEYDLRLAVSGIVEFDDESGEPLGQMADDADARVFAAIEMLGARAS